MKGDLSKAFASKNDPETDLKFRLSRLPQAYQDKYKTIVETQSKRVNDLNEELSQKRPKELEIYRNEELLKLTAPKLQPEWGKLTRVDIQRKADENADRRLQFDESKRKENLNKRHFNDRKLFIENAERQQRKPMRKQFNERSQKLGDMGKSR